MFAYALTIFLSAFLLFQVQPLIGKFILPWFGGGPGVWTTCLLFFQMFLLLGYAYAHLSARWLKLRGQAVLHISLLGLALTLLPIIPSDSWKPSGNENPTIQILCLLAATLGLPYLMLSSTAPLLQHWASRTSKGSSPYRLYALSNAGSLLALLSYPFFVETHFTRRTQALMWGWGLVGLVLCCGACAVKVVIATAKAFSSERTEPIEKTKEKYVPPEREFEKSGALFTAAFWLLLPACASILLLAVTNKLCQDVAVVPFLWVVPLALYLLSFIISFDSPRWYRRFPFALALIGSFAGLCWAIFRGDHWPLWKLIAFYSPALFVCCMICHGELFRLRPESNLLTRFYLTIAAGGAIGGVFVAVLAPLLFKGYYELHIGILLCAVLFLGVCLAQRHSLVEIRDWQLLAWTLPAVGFVGLNWLFVCLVHDCPSLKILLVFLWAGSWIFAGLLLWQALRISKLQTTKGGWYLLVCFFFSWAINKKLKERQPWRWLACIWLSLGLVALGSAMWLQRERPIQRIVDSSRNFYGRLRVFEDRQNEPQGHFFGLVHGRISHGWQFVDPVRAKWPTLYYSEKSGVGLAMQRLTPEPRRIGVVGLGVGTLASYVRSGDYMKIYEINPEVEREAKRWFTYLRDCPGKVEIKLGDARLSLEREQSQQFDLLVLDAFNGDAIPTHLLTREAFQLYGRHIKTNGIIAVHISNNCLDLEPVLGNIAREFNLRIAVIGAGDDPEQWWIMYSIWVILTRNDQVIDSTKIREVSRLPNVMLLEVPLWTDDFSSLFQILK